MTELEQYIKSYFGVRQEDLKLIVSLFKQTQLEKGDYFLKTGKYSTQLSFIKSGILRVYNISDGKEVTQWISTQGYFVTDLASWIFDTPHVGTFKHSPMSNFTPSIKRITTKLENSFRNGTNLKNYL